MKSNQFLECAKTAFSDLKIEANEDQIEQVALYFEQSVENEHDICDLVFHNPKSQSKSEDYYKGEIERLERIIQTYENSVKERRNCSKVWTENGRVFYE